MILKEKICYKFCIKILMGHNTTVPHLFILAKSTLLQEMNSTDEISFVCGWMSFHLFYLIEAGLP